MSVLAIFSIYQLGFVLLIVNLVNTFSNTLDVYWSFKSKVFWNYFYTVLLESFNIINLFGTI